MYSVGSSQVSNIPNLKCVLLPGYDSVGKVYENIQQLKHRNITLLRPHLKCERHMCMLPRVHNRDS